MRRTHASGRREHRPLSVTVDPRRKGQFPSGGEGSNLARAVYGRTKCLGDTTRSVPARALITTMDQGISSCSNFAVGVVVARVSGVAGLGAFSLAYAAWVFIASLHRSLITNPMAIAGDARHPTDARANIKRGFASEVLLGLGAGLIMALLGLVLVAAGQVSFGVAQLAMAPWIIVLLLQDYWRWIGFMKGKPGKALVNDLVFDLIQAAGFGLLFVAHIHSAPLAIAAWGLGALGGAILGLWQFRVWPSFFGRLHVAPEEVGGRRVASSHLNLVVGFPPALRHLYGGVPWAGWTWRLEGGSGPCPGALRCPRTSGREHWAPRGIACLR